MNEDQTNDQTNDPSTPNDDDDPIRGWAILELMGHRRLGGFLSTQEIAGAALVRIEIPGKGPKPEATQFYSIAAVYCISPTTERLARAVADRNRPEPVHRYELPSPERATYTDDDDDEGYGRGEDDDEDYRRSEDGADEPVLFT